VRKPNRYAICVEIDGKEKTLEEVFWRFNAVPLRRYYAIQWKPRLVYFKRIA